MRGASVTGIHLLPITSPHGAQIHHDMTAPLPKNVERNPPGPPLLLDDDMRRRIEEVAGLDGTVNEMAYYCDVDRSTIYRWFKMDPELRDRVEKLRSRPILAARQEVVNGIKGDKDFALKYLERKAAKEFMPTAKLNVAGTIETAPLELDKKAEEIREQYEAELRKALAEPEPSDIIEGELEAPADKEEGEKRITSNV